MTKGGGRGWNPTSFGDVVAQLDSMPMRINLNVAGTRTCPAPNWDPHRTYRVVLVDGKPTIQRLVDGAWEAAGLEPPPAPLFLPAIPPREMPALVGGRPSKTRTTETRLFISHSSDDVELAKALTSLVDAALTVPKGWLRCTSVPGFKLEPGADTPDELRRNLADADVVVGLLTPASLDSAYVLMELGAAWGFESWVVPLLAAGVDFEAIPGPIGQTVHAVRAIDESDVAALLESISNRCEMEWRGDMARRHTLVQEFAARARGPKGAAIGPAEDADGGSGRDTAQAADVINVELLRFAKEQETLYKHLWQQGRTIGVNVRNRSYYIQRAADHAEAAAKAYREAGDVLSAIKWEQIAKSCSKSV